jgi:hypothetical protein
LLGALVASAFLTRTTDGRYARISDGAQSPRPRMARASLDRKPFEVKRVVGV